MRRLVAGVAVGVLVVAAVAVFAPWQVDVVAFWDGVAAAFVTVAWVEIGGLDSTATAAHALREDDTRSLAWAILVTAATVSLVGVGLTLAKAATEGGAAEVVLTVVAVVTIMLSWGVVHTTYVLRYARLFYEPPVGGVDFNEDDDPDYRDFAYLALTVGMTFQVSDTDIEQRPIRRTITGHAVLSYVFGVVIIAATINIVAGFVS